MPQELKKSVEISTSPSVTSLNDMGRIAVTKDHAPNQSSPLNDDSKRKSRTGSDSKSTRPKLEGVRSDSSGTLRKQLGFQFVDRRMSDTSQSSLGSLGSLITKLEPPDLPTLKDKDIKGKISKAWSHLRAVEAQIGKLPDEVSHDYVSVLSSSKQLETQLHQWENTFEALYVEKTKRGIKEISLVELRAEIKEVNSYKEYLEKRLDSVSAYTGDVKARQNVLERKLRQQNRYLQRLVMLEQDINARLDRKIDTVRAYIKRLEAQPQRDEVKHQRRQEALVEQFAGLQSFGGWDIGDGGGNVDIAVAKERIIAQWQQNENEYTERKRAIQEKLEKYRTLLKSFNGLNSSGEQCGQSAQDVLMQEALPLEAVDSNFGNLSDNQQAHFFDSSSALLGMANSTSASDYFSLPFGPTSGSWTSSSSDLRRPSLTSVVNSDSHSPYSPLTSLDGSIVWNDQPEQGSLFRSLSFVLPFDNDRQTISMHNTASINHDVVFTDSTNQDI